MSLLHATSKIPGIDLRPCRPGDLPAVRALLEQAGLCTDGVEVQFGDAYVVAETSGAAVGCAGVESHGPDGLLRSVAVSPAWRGKGIGEALVADRLNWARARGLGSVFLLTTDASRYFERLGFREFVRKDAPPAVAGSVEFSAACPQSAVAMRLELTSGSDTTKGTHMDIKGEVREKYAEAARQVLERMDTGKISRKASCCGSERPAGTQDAITADLYGKADQEQVPLDALLASLGCGNPTALAELRAGEVVLDLGSGGGIDVILSAKRVGSTGKAYGLDMTDEMLEVARRNARTAGVENVEFLKGEIESVPLPDDSVDVVISNCVINLSPDKRRVLREAYRVLKPGGRFAVADIVARGPIPEAIRKNMEMWTGCIAGALEDGRYRDYLEEAGFERIEFEPTRVFRVEKGGCCGDAVVGVEAGAADEPGQGVFMSAFIRAEKPRSAA